MSEGSGSRARQASSVRLADWFRDLRGPLRKFIGRRRRLASADLDDMAQEVYLRLLRYDRVELVEDPRAYLFRIAANVASEWAMRAHERLPHAANWLDDLTTDVDAVSDYERGERQREVQEAMAGLSLRAREILRLRYNEDLDNDAIAQRLGISLRVVRRDLAHSYTHLRLVLGAPRVGDP